MVSSPGRIFKSTRLFLQKAWTVILHRASPSCRSWRITQSLFPLLPEPLNPIQLLFHLFLVKKLKKKKEETYQPSSCVNAQRQPLSSWIWVHRQCLSSPSGLGTSSFWTAWAAALNNIIFHYKINMSSLLHRFAAKPALCAVQCKLKRCSCPGVCPLLVSVHSKQTCVGKQATTWLILGYFRHCYTEFSMKSAANSSFCFTGGTV